MVSGVLSWFSKNLQRSFLNIPDKTEWGIGWLPFGGYCSIAGMIDESNTSGRLSFSRATRMGISLKESLAKTSYCFGRSIDEFRWCNCYIFCYAFVWGKETLPMQNATLGYDYTEVALKNGFQNGDIVQSIDGKKLLIYQK